MNARAHSNSPSKRVRFFARRNTSVDDFSEDGDENSSVIGVYALSRDHLPSIEAERLRILNSGGEVRPTLDQSSGKFIGPDRVWLAGEDYPGLMMSRSFGDLMAHECGVTEIPEVKIINYNPHIHKGLILASDGVWEHMNNI